MFLIWKPKILVGILGNVLDRLRYCCLQSDVGWIGDWVCCDGCEWPVTWHMMCWPWCHTRDDVTTLGVRLWIMTGTQTTHSPQLTHLIECPDTSHIRIFGARERRSLYAPMPPLFKAVFMARLHLPAIKDLQRPSELMCRQKRRLSILQSMRRYLPA